MSGARMTGHDFAGRVYFDYNGALWKFTTGYTEIGDNFNPEVGFVPRRGYRKPEARIEFAPEPNHRYIRKFAPHVSFSRHYGLDGLLESEFQHYDYEMYFHNGAIAGWTLNSRLDTLRRPFEVFPGFAIPVGTYRFTDFSVDAKSDPSAPLFIEGQYTRGGFYNGDIRTWDLQGGFRWGAKLLTTLGVRDRIVSGLQRAIRSRAGRLPGAEPRTPAEVHALTELLSGVPRSQQVLVFRRGPIALVEHALPAGRGKIAKIVASPPSRGKMMIDDELDHRRCSAAVNTSEMVSTKYE